MNITIRFSVITLIFSLLLSSCSIVADRTDSDVSSSANLLESAVYKPRIVADFRDHNTQLRANGLDIKSGVSAQASINKESNAQAKEIVEATLGAGSFEQYRLADSARGSFTSTEQQSLHIIVNRRATSVGKNNMSSIIVIFQDSQPIIQFVVTKATYLAVVSVFDADNDDMNEVLLSAAAYQMGTRFVTAHVYSFKDPTDILKQELGIIYANGCESTIADAQVIRAASLSLTPSVYALMADSYVAPCDLENATPSIDQFIAKPHQQQK